MASSAPSTKAWQRAAGQASGCPIVVATGFRGFPNIMGGVESHCEELLPRLRTLSGDLRIIAAGRRPYLPSRRQVHKDIPVIGMPCPKSAKSEAITSTFCALLYAFWKRAKLVHIHAIGPGLLSPLAKLLGMKVVVTHHGADYDRGKWGSFAKAVLKTGERFSMAAADAVIVVSPSMRIALAARWPARAHKLRFVPNGSGTLPDDGVARPDVLRSLGLEEDDYVLAVGRLVPEKGFDYLVRAFLASGRKGKLAIAGAADHESQFSRDLVKMAGDRVRFLGPQDRATLRHLYNGASLFVLPSYHEGLPIAALEASQCGCPMLLSDIGGNLDIGLPGHCYFPVGNERALAMALKLPSNNFRADHSSVSDRFNWDSIAQETLIIYSSLLKAR